MLAIFQYILLLFLGLSSIIAGLVGIVLPFLPGVLLIVAGLVILSLLSPAVEGWLHKTTEKFPLVHNMVKDVQTFIRRIMGR